MTIRVNAADSADYAKGSGVSAPMSALIAGHIRIRETTTLGSDLLWPPILVTAPLSYCQALNMGH